MRKLLALMLLMPSVGLASEAYLTVGRNHNFMLGGGYSAKLDIVQPLSRRLSACPYGSFDRNDGFHDRMGGMDLSYELSPRLTLSIGAEYEKYELLAADDPTESHDIHTAIKIKIW